MEHIKKVYGKLVKLRALESSDLPLLYAWENDTELWKEGATLMPFSREDLKKYLDSIKDLHCDKQLRLVIESITNSEVIGLLDLYDYDPIHRRAGVGILIDKAQQRKGYALDSLAIIANYANEILGLHQLHCSIRQSNKASISLFETAGYSCSGQIKDWFRSGNELEDQLIFQKILTS